MNRIVTIIFTILLSLAASGQDKDGIRFEEKKTWKELLALSQKSGKLIFLDCYTSWCGPCKAMASKVFTQNKVGSFMNATFISAKIDMEKGEGIELHKTYKTYIPGFPTYLLINAKGEVVFQISGFMEAEEFIRSIKEGLDQKTWIAYKKKYENGERNWDFQWEYIQLLEAAYQRKEHSAAVKLSVTTLSLNDIKEYKGAYEIFKRYYSDVSSPLFNSFMQDPQIPRKYNDSAIDISEWSGKLYNNRVMKLTSILTHIDSTFYDKKGADSLLHYLNKFDITGKEELITILILNDYLYNAQYEQFFATLDHARLSGLLKNKENLIREYCMKFFRNTDNPAYLDNCLRLTFIDKKSSFLPSSQLKIYAHFLEKSGNAELANEYYLMADNSDKKKFGLGKYRSKPLVQIEGNIPNANRGAYVYLYTPASGQETLDKLIDSARIDAYGKFVFNSKNLQAIKYLIRYGNSTRSLYADYLTSRLSLDQNTQLWKVVNNKTDQLLGEYEIANTTIAYTQSQIALASKKNDSEGTKILDNNQNSQTTNADSAYKQKEKIVNEILEYGGIPAAYILSSGKEKFSFDTYTKAYKLLKDYEKASPYGIKMKEEMNRLINLK